MPGQHTTQTDFTALTDGTQLARVTGPIEVVPAPTSVSLALITQGGLSAIPAGTYSFAASKYTPYGETTACAVSSITVPSGNTADTIQITVNGVTFDYLGYQGCNVYRQSAGVLHLLYSVGGTVFNFTIFDIGAGTTGTQPPTTNNAAMPIPVARERTLLQLEQAASASLTNVGSIDTKTPNRNGTWGYYAGVSGTAQLAAGERVLGIAAHSSGSGATVSISGGANIPVPTGVGLCLNPEGTLQGARIIFTGTDSYFVEVVS